MKKYFWIVSGLLLSKVALAEEVAGRINRLQGAVMPIGFAIGGLMAVITLFVGMFSDKYGWGPFMKVLVSIGALAVVNAVIATIKSSLGGGL